MGESATALSRKPRMDGCAAVNAWIRHRTVAKAVDGQTYRRADADGQICHRSIAEAKNG